MKSIALLGAAIIAGAVRYPSEGVLIVSDEDADRLIAAEQAEEVDLSDAGESDDELGRLTVADLKKIAEDEAIDLGEATKKADIIAAIEKHRAG